MRRLFLAALTHSCASSFAALCAAPVITLCSPAWGEPPTSPNADRTGSSGASDPASNPEAPAPVGQASDDERPPTPNETIRPGKRPLLKLHGGATPTEKIRPAPPLVVPTSYQGVAPGGDKLPPRPPKLPVAGPARMTWPGFQIRDGSPTVFIELTGPVEWSVAESPGVLTYTLKNVTIPLRNNRRALEVREFHTVVQAIDARPKGRDVQVTIRLARASGPATGPKAGHAPKVAHKERTEEAAGGYKLLVVELSSEARAE